MLETIPPGQLLTIGKLGPTAGAAITRSAGFQRRNRPRAASWSAAGSDSATPLYKVSKSVDDFGAIRRFPAKAAWRSPTRFPPHSKTLRVCWPFWTLLLLALALVGCGRRETASDQTLPNALTNAQPKIVEIMNRGVSLMGQYQYDQAVQAFEEVLQSEPGLQDGQINLAIALFNRNKKEDLERGQQLLEEVLKKDPRNDRALYFKAIILQHSGNAEAAIPLLEDVLNRRPDDGAAWYILGLCKIRVGQPGEAELRKAVQFRPYLYSAYYQLFQAALRAGNEAEANQYLERFKSLRESPLGESIELPQYNAMGELALVTPVRGSAPTESRVSRYSVGAPKTIYSWPSPAARNGANTSAAETEAATTGAAIGDLDRDGRADIVVPAGTPGGLLLLLQKASGAFTNTTANSGLEQVTGALNTSIGDYDNDEIPDLLVTGPSTVLLFRGSGEGTFTNVTAQSGLGTLTNASSGLLLDADHDGDLDVFLCDNSSVLLQNSGDGSFTNTPSARSFAEVESRFVLPGDLDGDQDMDLVLLGQRTAFFANELLSSFTPTNILGGDLGSERGGVLQDFNGDGFLDLLVLGGEPARLTMLFGNGQGSFERKEAFTNTARSPVGVIRGLRVADADLDGDLDVITYGTDVYLALNDGRGQFGAPIELLKPSRGKLAFVECADLTGDFMPDLLAVETGPTNYLILSVGELRPHSSAVALHLSGVRSRDGRTRSPASGYGARVTMRTGLSEHHRFYTGVNGGPAQSSMPLVIGLAGASKADHLGIQWPDGVSQVEIGLEAGKVHKIEELERKVSSCPVLFTWNGERFEFVTDFAGVGGLGYFSAPGVYAPPQPLEHVKIEPSQLRPTNGFYELRVTEPMEESAYIDKLELLAIDHPQHKPVYPDERLAISGPPPTRELLVVERAVFPVKASDPDGNDCTDLIRTVDRIYAYDPPLDRRYVGFCKPHTLELDFGNTLDQFDSQDRVFLFLNGFIEYPYSQTVYAASQSRLGWEPIRIDRQDESGAWETIVPDAGAPGGMGRMMTVDLSGTLKSGTTKLRLTSNLEIFYDQVFISRDAGDSHAVVRTLPLREATARRVGFALEHSPDGRLPLIYDYERTEPTAPFRTLKGAYTRYGPVDELLANVDDRFVIIGSGDEIALRFEASLPPIPESYARSFILISQAYCKDMDLYTGTPRTLEPLPYRGMPPYPYSPSERTKLENQEYLRIYNTRMVE